MADRTTFQHALRGLNALPHVGHHPGIPITIILIGIGAAAGTQRAGLWGAVLGGAFSAIWVLPILLIGAVGRSRLSDRLDAKTRR